jgi:hypothetical protein
MLLPAACSNSMMPIWISVAPAPAAAMTAAACGTAGVDDVAGDVGHRDAFSCFELPESCYV